MEIDAWEDFWLAVLAFFVGYIAFTGTYNALIGFAGGTVFVCFYELFISPK